MQMEPANLKQKKDKPKMKYFVDSICPFPFDKSITMVPFPPNVARLKYDKYTGETDPHDHVREFCALSIEYMHEPTYLMRLFPGSLGGNAMEWFSKLNLKVKTFDELIQ